MIHALNLSKIVLTFDNLEIRKKMIEFSINNDSIKVL